MSHKHATVSLRRGQRVAGRWGGVVCLGRHRAGFPWRHLSGLGISRPDRWHLLAHHVAPVLWGQMADEASEADDARTLHSSLPADRERGKRQIDSWPKIIYKVLIDCTKVNLAKSRCIMIGACQIDAFVSLRGSWCLFKVKYHHEATVQSCYTSSFMWPAKCICLSVSVSVSLLFFAYMSSRPTWGNHLSPLSRIFLLNYLSLSQTSSDNC